MRVRAFVRLASVTVCMFLCLSARNRVFSYADTCAFVG